MFSPLVVPPGSIEEAQRLTVAAAVAGCQASAEVQACREGAHTSLIGHAHPAAPSQRHFHSTEGGCNTHVHSTEGGCNRHVHSTEGGCKCQRGGQVPSGVAPVGAPCGGVHLAPESHAVAITEKTVQLNIPSWQLLLQPCSPDCSHDSESQASDVSPASTWMFTYAPNLMATT